MFITKNQIFIFIACLAFGGLGGGVLSFFQAIKFFIKNKIIKILLDLFGCVCVGVAYVHFSHSLKFPNFRAYMMVGVFVGIFLHLKSFHIILAKIAKKIYNIFINKYKIKKAKITNGKNAKKLVGRKGKKTHRCRHGGGNSSRGNFDNGYGISTHFNRSS